MVGHISKELLNAIEKKYIFIFYFLLHEIRQGRRMGHFRVSYLLLL